MINLETFFINHFDTEKISDNNMKLFAEIHLQLMTANNPGGIYSTRITATTTAYTGYFGAISDEDVKTALQQGLTITMNNAMKNFLKTVQQKEGIVKGTWGKASAEYQEFFPHGLNEYDQINLSTAETLMNRMVAASTAHVADLGAPFVTLFTDLRSAFTDARTAQLTVMGEVLGLKTGSETTRNDLEEALMTDLLFAAMNNIGHPERMTDFFDQSFIHKAAGGTRIRKAHVTVAPNDVANFDVTALNIDFEKVTTIDYAAKEAPGDFFAGIAPDSLPGDTFLSVAANSTTSLNNEDSKIELGADETHIYINVKNTGTVIGHYTITFTEED